MMNSMVTIRLNNTDTDRLNRLIDTLTDAEIDQMIENDRSHRNNYRNYSGRKPSRKITLLRQAIHLGLQQIEG